MKKLMLTTIIITSVIISGCATTTRVELDSEPIRSAEFQASDLRTTIDKMARDLVVLPTLNQREKNVVIGFAQVENKTGEQIDGYNMQSNIREILLKNASDKIKFVDRSQATLDVINEENKWKNEGFVDGKVDTKLTGIDYILGGYLYKLGKSADGKKDNYYRMSFRLTDIRNSQVVWESSYEVRRSW